MFLCCLYNRSTLVFTGAVRIEEENYGYLFKGLRPLSFLKICSIIKASAVYQLTYSILFCTLYVFLTCDFICHITARLDFCCCSVWLQLFTSGSAMQLHMLFKSVRGSLDRYT